MRNFIYLVSLLLIADFSIMAHNKITAPDFDYPTTVAENADCELTKALKAGNEHEITRYIVQSSLAKSMLTTDNTQTLIERVDSVAEVAQNGAYKAILYHFEAKMLSNYFERYRFKISERLSAPDAENIDEWSTDRFRSRIIELTEKCVDDYSVSASMKLEELGDLIEKNDYSHLFYPSVYDMLGWNSIELIDEFASSDKRAADLIEEIRKNLMTIHADGSAPFLNAKCYGKNADELLNIYRRYFDSTDMAFLAIDGLTVLPDTERHSAYSQFLLRYPSSIFAYDVKRLKADMETLSAELRLSDRFSSAEPIEIECNVANATDFTIYVFSLPDFVTDLYRYRGKWEALPIRRYKSVHLEGSAPFRDTVKVTLPALGYGRYFVYCDTQSKSGPTIYEKLKNVPRYTLQTFIVSDIMLFTASVDDETCRVFAVDASSGKPLSGVTLTVTDTGTKFLTDKTGSVLLRKAELKGLRYNSFDVKATLAEDKLTSLSATFSKRYDYSNNFAEIFLDLPVYHPGDTVNFAAVYYATDKSSNNSVIPGKELSVMFSDSNYEHIDSLTVTTDEMGRIEGSFIVPRDRMNGTFHLEVSCEDDELTDIDVEVSDYKAPTFYVEIDSRDFYNKGKDVTLTGKALTYTGMPVADARIEAEVSRTEWLWRFFGSSNREHLLSIIATTAADGSFSLTIPADSLIDIKSSFRFSQFVADVNITSAAGETQSASASFRTEQFCSISVVGNSDLCFNSEKEIILPIMVKNSDETAVFECSYTISDIESGAVIADGSFAPDKPLIQANSSMKSGKYKCTVSGPHNAQCDMEITLFSPADKLPPVESPLWIPDCENTVTDDNRVNILLGNTNAESHIYCIAASRNKVITDGWLIMKPGMHRLTYDIPRDEKEFIDFTFITVCGGKTYHKHFRHNSKYRPCDISIVPVVFRNNLVPGTPERWSFRLLDASGNPAQCAMICEMMDKALTQIRTNEWNLSATGYNFDVAWWNIINPSLRSTTFTKRISLPIQESVSILCPTLNTYNVNMFYPTYSPRRFRNKLLNAKSAGDAEVGMSANMIEMAVGAPPLSMGTAEEADAKMSDIIAEDAAEARPSLENVKVRTAVNPTALWRPTLRTDKDGYIYIDFNAPDLSTTWIMQAVAYSADMHTARIVKEVMTKRPLMVRANMPRFVRQGDKVQISSSLTNASDSAMQCTALVEIFSLTDDSVFASESLNVTIAAGETKPIEIEWEVPDGLACVGYRIKAASASFGDGEQHSLVILPSVSPVVETKPFFIDASTSNFTLPLPKFTKGSRVTLEYCNNPVWYCVTALPSVKTDDCTTSTALAHSLYALTVASGIANSSPDIREAIDLWMTDNADSTLVSNLAKNEDLKISTLLASPWIRESQRQTLRMRSIADLFDEAKNSAETDKILSKLEELQMPDGGWTWVKYRNCESSFFATHTVLQLIGEVRRLGFLSGNNRIDKMLVRAIAYYDATQLERFNRRINKNDYSNLSDYVYTRSLFNDIAMSAEMSRIYKKALTSMQHEWKGQSLPVKAYFAMALHRSGNSATAKEILNSLRQFSITKPNTGMYWDNLQIGWDCFYSKTSLTATILSAFAEIEPESTDIDLIRKWVLLDKQANDWGNSSMASAAINALLSSGSKWLGKQDAARIAIAGQNVDTANADRFIGYFKREIEVGSTSIADLTIERSAKSPAWGALYCQYAAPMTSVKASKVDELSIEKELYVVNGDRLVKSAAMNVGDKVQVRMIIKNSRDLQYVTLHDERAACCEPVEQLSEYRWLDGTGFYMEIKNDATRIFFNYLPKGTHVITYDVHISAPGKYNVGVASVQSQYAPQIAAHSAGSTITVDKK